MQQSFSHPHCHRQWTAALRTRFLDELAIHGNARAAAAACGLSRQSAYKLRRRDPRFARKWDAALARLREQSQAEFARLLAEWLPSLGGAGTSPLDTVNMINPVSTADRSNPAGLETTSWTPSI